MFPLRNLTLLSALGAAAVVALSCDRAATPVSPQVDKPLLHIFPGEELACFRLTGGGRIDKPEPAILMPQPKNTPTSRDFATFGFQARPNGCNVPDGSGQIEWVEHNPSAILDGFSFHGEVTWFVAVQDHYGETGDPKNGCGRFSGFGRIHGRDGFRSDGVAFIVEHACDRGEPGVGRDHIRICIGTADPTDCNVGTAPYRRDGILTGGNIQKHRLTGSGA
jgi:hypothetical protein